jgi:hypothetical protein
MGYFNRMREVRLATAAELRPVMLRGEIVSAAQKLQIIGGAIAADLVQQLGKAHVDSMPSGETDSRVSCRAHVQLL